MNLSPPATDGATPIAVMTGRIARKSPKMEPRLFVLRPEDTERRAAKMAVQALKNAVKEPNPVEVVIQDWKPPRTDPQRRTLWMWHGQVASELTIRTGKRWDKDSVHEIIFLARWMPQIEYTIPDTGEVIRRPMRTSDKPPEGEERSTKEIISDAMNEYLAWIYGMGIEVLVPENYNWR
jgi:hypothetical protein